MKNPNTQLTAMKTIIMMVVSVVVASTHAMATKSNGCLVAQGSNVEAMIMHEGKIGQTFAPCESGILEFIQLWVESTDNMTFAVKLSILENGEAIATQQFVVPARKQSDHVKAWLAKPPKVKAGTEYTIELEVPEGNSFYAYYSPTDPYEQGKMTINGLMTYGDLAFEAGIKTAEPKSFFSVNTRTTNGCAPEGIAADRSVACERIEAQTFQLCEDLRISGITVQYRATVGNQGELILRKAGSEEALATVPYAVQATDEMTPLLFDLEEFQANSYTEYEILITAENEGLQFYYSSGDPYLYGSLQTDPAEEGNDLCMTFEIVESIVEEEETAYHLFNQYQEHDCSVSQPYWSHHQEIQGPAIVEVEVPICDDGDLEAIYFRGSVEGGVEGCYYEVYNDKGTLKASGALEVSQQWSTTLVAAVEDLQVLGFIGYTVKLFIPEGKELSLAYSDSQEHGGLMDFIDNVPFDGHVCYAVGMKPFVVNFEEATEDRNNVSFNVFPNPFLSDFSIDITGLEGRTAIISLYNFQGIEVYRTEVEGAAGTQTVQVLPEETLSRGYHTLRIEYGDQVLLETVLKQ